MNRTMPLTRSVVSVVVSVGALITIGAAVLGVLRDAGGLGPGWLLAIGAIVLTSTAPLYLERYDDWLVVGNETCVLVFLALTLDWPHALSLWVVGILLAELVSRVRTRTIFATSLSIVSGGIAVGVVTLFDTGAFGFVEVVAVFVAFTAAFAVEVAASIATVAPAAPPAGGGPVERALEVVSLYALYLGATAIGYVAVLLYRNASPWALLAAVPAVVIVLAAVKGVTRERETARRLNILFETANALHSASTDNQVLSALDAGVRQLGKVPGSGMHSTLPPPGDLRRLFISGDDVWWLVIPHSAGPRASTLRISEALESIAQQAEEALSRMRMNRDLVLNAQRDPLTKLSNRSVFMDTVDAAMRDEDGSYGRDCAILFCDLDGFKKVNDQFGHTSGDDALVEVARRLTEELPDDVDVARLGGDEFAVLVRPLPGGPAAGGSEMSGAETGGSAPVESRALEVATQAREALARPFLVDSRTIEITVSIGVASADAVQESATELLRNADIAMYAAKRNGRDRVVVYCAAMGVERMRSLELVDRLRRAIDERRLRVVYQPIVSAVDQSLLTVEALARWTEDGEVVTPDEFIPLAEEANLIEPLGALVLEKVCDDLEQLEHAFEPTTAIAVNLSARQLESPQFVERIGQALEHLAPHPLTLEVTETESISEEVIDGQVVDQLIERGARLAVDDFGVGFSSLERLMRLPVQVLKLDRIFSHEIDTDENRAAFLTSLIDMAAASRLRIVVEGIERRTQVDAVLSRVSEERRERLAFQGYLFGGPMSPATMVRWAAQRQRSALLRRT